MYPYPKLSADFQEEWSPDGSTLYLRNPKTRRAFRLTRPMGQLLCTLDGWTRPGRKTGLSSRAVYRYLRSFACHGLLQEPDRLITDFGTLLLSFPCPALRQGRSSALLHLYYRLICWGWLPLLGGTLAVCFRSGLPPLHFSFSPMGTLLCYALLEIPALLLHEWAHAAAANAHGLPVSSFGLGINSFFPCAFTLIPLLPYAPRRVRRAVFQVGPLSNLCAGCVCLLLLQAAPSFLPGIVFSSAVVNFVLALLNLFPWEGLDGNGILSSFPALDRALHPERLRRRAPWETLLEQGLGLLLRGPSRIGAVAFLLYEGLSLLTLIVEEWFL